MTRDEMQAHLIVHGWRPAGYLSIMHDLHTRLYINEQGVADIYPTSVDTSWKRWSDVPEDHLIAFCTALEYGMHLLLVDPQKMLSLRIAAMAKTSRLALESIRYEMLDAHWASKIGVHDELRSAPLAKFYMDECTDFKVYPDPRPVRPLRHAGKIDHTNKFGTPETSIAKKVSGLWGKLAARLK
jgi:hypothetical protein